LFCWEGVHWSIYKSSDNVSDISYLNSPHSGSLSSLGCVPDKRNMSKATEANKRRGQGTRERVSSRRINLEGNTHAQEINVSQLPV
jgi:hypothetical protein